MCQSACEPTCYCFVHAMKPDRLCLSEERECKQESLSGKLFASHHHEEFCRTDIVRQESVYLPENSLSLSLSLPNGSKDLTLLVLYLGWMMC
jgi:hypothetical protein